MSSSAMKTLTKRRRLPASSKSRSAEAGVGHVQGLEGLADGRPLDLDLADASGQGAQLGGYADFDAHRVGSSVRWWTPVCSLPAVAVEGLQRGGDGRRRAGDGGPPGHRPS